MNVKNTPYKQVIALGLVAGMRAMSTPAFTSMLLYNKPSKRLDGTPFNLLQTSNALRLLPVLAVGEFIGDKLPNAPDRISPPGLIGRLASGALAGAALYKAEGCNPVSGAAIGSVTALAASFGFFFLRKFIVNKSRIADPVIGVAEDLLAIGTGAALLAGG